MGINDFYASKGPGTGYRFTSRRSGSALSYPSPFFDIAQTYLPSDIRTLFQWCRYYFLSNPIINAVCYKMAAYPIRNLIYETTDYRLKEQWKHLFEDVLNLRTFQIEAGLDRACYGNAFISVVFPFYKFLECRKCKSRDRVENLRKHWKFRSMHFELTCPVCGEKTKAKVIDHYYKSYRDIKLIRWNPENIRIDYNETTGTYTYLYKIPKTLGNDLRIGKSSIVETTPDIYLRAIRLKKNLILNPKNVYHMRRANISHPDERASWNGWGMPMILPVLKDTFYMQILRKAQEAIATDHVVPLRVIFPQAGSSTSDPYRMVDLAQWRGEIEEEITRWKYDNNYIPILPIPMGHETISGQGKALMVHQEIRGVAEQIVSGMGFPVEFVFGGLSYSGSNVSLRFLENEFIGYLQDQLLMVRFVLDTTATYMDWTKIPVRHEKFKMADDLQRSAYYFQMNQAQKLSDRTLLEDSNFELEIEEKRKSEEIDKQIAAQEKMQISQATIQGKVQRVMTQQQMAMQNDLSGGGAAAPPPAAGAGQPPGAGQQPPGQAPPGQAPPGQGPAGAPAQASMYPQSNQQPQNVPKEMQSQLSMQSAASPGGVSMGYAAKRVADAISTMENDVDRFAALNTLAKQNQQLYALVLSMLGQKQENRQPMSASSMPLPNQKPPRRDPSSGLV